MSKTERPFGGEGHPGNAPAAFLGPARGILARTDDRRRRRCDQPRDVRLSVGAGLRRNPMDQRIESYLADVLALAGEDPDVIRDAVRAALGDLLDGFVLTALIAVAIGTIYYAIRLVTELRRLIRR
jgi:hypothetical protein